MQQVKECVGFLARKKHALSSCNWEDLTIDIEPHLARKNAHKLIFSRVNMGRRFGACSHFREVKRAVIVRGPLYQVELLNPGDLLYALGVLSSSSIVRPVTTLCSVVRFSVLTRFLLRGTKHFVCALIPARYQNCAGAQTYAWRAQHVEGAVLRQCSRWNAFEISDENR
jgi:hypothetical protein